MKNSVTRGSQWLAPVLMVAALGTAAGCRTSEKDVERWTNTQQGQRKLEAVLLHGKYDMELRTQAALALAKVPAKNGKRIGLLGDDEHAGLIAGLRRLTTDERKEILAKLVPELVTGMTLPVPTAVEGKKVNDPTYPFKDAAYALLETGDQPVVTDSRQLESLAGALAAWVTVDFDRRVDDAAQVFSVEQVCRSLKAPGVRALPALLKEGYQKNDLIARLIAELGDATTKQAASDRLVAIAQQVDAQPWIDRMRPEVSAVNVKSKLKVTPAQLEAQLKQYQEEQLLKVFGSLKRVGGKNAAAYLITYAQSPTQSDKKRAAALAALEGNVGKEGPAMAKALVALAGGDTVPDQVRDMAFARIGEFPRDTVIGDLYSLFSAKRWQVRWASAELVLKMSQAKHADEFFGKLAGVPGMAITEPLRYGSLLKTLAPPPSTMELVHKYSAVGNAVEQRLTALGYYYEFGTAESLPELAPFVQDSQRLPKCLPDAQGCEWNCTVQEGAQSSTKEIGTLGEFVRYCLQPVLEARASKPAPAGAAPKGK